MIALIYVLPLTVMFVAYSVIGFTLWRRTVPGNYAHGANTHHLQAKKKVGTGSMGGRAREGRDRRPGSAPGAVLGSRPALKGAPQSAESARTLPGSQVPG